MKKYVKPKLSESVAVLRASLLVGSSNVSPTNPSGYHDHKDYPNEDGWHGGWHGGWGN